jgi:hypothetical protein
VHAQEPDPERWFPDHYDGAASQIIDFIIADGIALAGKHVADIGSGDEAPPRCAAQGRAGEDRRLEHCSLRPTGSR